MNPVALILNPEFGQGVERIAREMPVWVLSSPTNDVAVEETRRKFKGAIDVTSFVPRRAGDRSATCAQALYDIDEHHGPWSSSRPYNELRIFGVSEADLPLDVLDELGLAPAESRGSALILHKHPGLHVAAR
ncbi:hypothetical protein [Massilia terrae]|uniref:Uncharacterized protein n=1 Tax=Massilia terrae TaxID=1811224 RepID=A0ABT2CV81_9BURK|nr:hypothetical protein [Massilia terrae]MCS0657887.1 hypothetical protein [Massilia terrae]